MSDLISRSALLRDMEERQAFLVKEYGYRDHYTSGYAEAVERVFAAPTIDNGVTIQKHGRCKYCEVPIYIKTIQYTAPMLAPLTRAEELRQELINITGEVYLRLPHNYCPNCGAKMGVEGET